MFLLQPYQGDDALTNFDSGGNDIAFGSEALVSNTAIDNTAVGAYAMLVNTIGNDNTAVGYNALNNNESGGYNCALGVQALVSNTSGSDNTALGSYALSVMALALIMSLPASTRFIPTPVAPITQPRARMRRDLFRRRRFERRQVRRQAGQKMRSFLMKFGSNRHLHSQTLTVDFIKPWNCLAKTNLAVKETGTISERTNLMWSLGDSNP